jgi:hypothetical protein
MSKPIEERIEQIERLHAEHMQMARDDRAAHIAWKREMESQVQATWLAIERASKRIDQMAEENTKGFAEMRAQSQETDRHLKELGEATDKRIEKLVSAIGDLIQRMDGKSVQ